MHRKNMLHIIAVLLSTLLVIQNVGCAKNVIAPTSEESIAAAEEENLEAQSDESSSAEPINTAVQRIKPYIPFADSEEFGYPVKMGVRVIFDNGRKIIQHSDIRIELHGVDNVGDIPDGESSAPEGEEPLEEEVTEEIQTAEQDASDEESYYEEESYTESSGGGYTPEDTYVAPAEPSETGAGYSGASTAATRKRAADPSEIGWLEIIEDVLEDGEYVMDMSGISNPYGPVERIIWSYLNDYFRDYYEGVLHFEDDPFNIEVVGDKAIITLSEAGKKMVTIEEYVVQTFGIATYGNDWDTVYETMNRVRNNMTYDLGYEEATLEEAVTARRGVCWAYSQIGMILLNAEGIPARTIFGTVDFASDYHEWIEAYIDGAWHAVDFTWGEIDSGAYVEGTGTNPTRAYEDVVESMEEEKEKYGSDTPVADPNDGGSNTPAADPNDSESNTPAADPNDGGSEASASDASADAEYEAWYAAKRAHMDEVWARLKEALPPEDFSCSWQWFDDYDTWLRRVEDDSPAGRTYYMWDFNTGTYVATPE